jgi:23S rRNA (guanosine2251-2'-O)-methyltransferase
VIPSRRSASVTAAAAKASAGAVEHLPISRVTNLAEWLVRAKDAGAWIYGADAAAMTSYTDADLSGKVVLVLGSEGAGLRRLVAERCDVLVSIPVRGRVDSLNVSASAAVLLFEAARQRGVAESRRR